MVGNGDHVTTSTKSFGHHSARRDKKSNAATGASAAGVRAFGSQALAFYFRAPAKAFFRTRVDYLAFARAINPRVQAQESWSLRLTTPALLTHAIRAHGWSFIPAHVLPPLLANVGIGAVLYTSYLQILGALHPPSSQSLKRVYPPPPPAATFTAGFAAGAGQSLIAAPLDALSVRFRTSDILSKRYNNMWSYSSQKLREIGLRGVMAGFGINCLKDSLGYGLFFMTFEYVKAQGYYRFVAMYYGDLRGDLLSPILKPKVDETGAVDVIRPHYAIEPVFLGLAGVAASVAQQTIAHPVERVQEIHYRSLAYLDRQARKQQPRREMVKSYLAAYRRTWQVCGARAEKMGMGWRRWLFKGFWWGTIKLVPSTAAGLVIFEFVRKRYGVEVEEVRIEEDGYDVLLT